MNIFIIPSWYPSGSNPIYGIFNSEHANLIARYRPEWNVGVSKWGQGDTRMLLPALSIQSYFKVFKSYEIQDEQVKSNLTEYFTPAFTWTRKILSGNIEGIYQANQANLKRYIGQYGKPDILCAQASYPASIIAQRMAKELEIPYIVTIFMSPFPFSEFLKGNKLKSLIAEPLKGAAQLLSSCTSLKKTMQEYDLDKISVVPFPVNADYFKPKKTTSPKVRILSIGRVVEQKGFDLLLKAVVGIGEDFELRIGGEGSLFSDYQKLTEKLGLSGKVTWLGMLSREQVLQEMQDCSFYVLSSRHETFGIVQVEAMACGKPVVATRCGGPEDIVSKRTGILCDLSEDGLRKGILEMMSRRGEFDGKEIRHEVIERFSPEVWIKKLESVFRSIL